MNNWGTQREVEKLKKLVGKSKKETRRERHARLRLTAQEALERISRRELAIVVTLGRDNPIRQELLVLHSLIQALMGELLS